MLVLHLFSIGAVMLSTVIGGLLVTNAVLSDIKNYLIEINENGKFEQNHFHATEQLTDFIQLHTLMNQLSEWPFLPKFQIY